MAPNRCAGAMLLLASALAFAGGDAAAEQPGWQLIWADEFDGTALDASKWNIQLGDGSAYGLIGWGNNELQTYRAENIAVADGKLTITARRENVDGGYGYTSARINTAGKFHARYGRFEASIRAPAGQGLWTAFWMLPEHSRYGSWAASGEIDIMEVYSRDPAPFVLGTAHYGMAWPLNVYLGGRSSQVDPADGFHVYAVEWDEQALRWFVDGIHYHTAPHASYWTYYRSSATNAHVAGGDSAPFDQPFHLLLNLAVGGNLPGDPDPSALPGRLLVDYVRAYRCEVDPRTGLGCAGSADRLDESVPPAPPGDVFRRQYVLYEDAPGLLEFADNDKTVALDFAADGDALALEEVDGGKRGRILDVRTSDGGHFSILAAKLVAPSVLWHGRGGAGGQLGRRTAIRPLRLQRRDGLQRQPASAAGQRAAAGRFRAVADWRAAARPVDDDHRADQRHRPQLRQRRNASRSGPSTQPVRVRAHRRRPCAAGQHQDPLRP